MNEDPLKSKILEWVKAHGFPFEMKVASIFENAGFNVQQSNYYSDPETGESREIDLICTLFKHQGNQTVSANYVIECKVAKKYPWVLFSSDRVLTGWNKSFIYATMSKISRNNLEEILTRNPDFDSKIPGYYTKKRIGFGVAEGMKTGDDTAFKAVMSSTKASIFYSERHLNPAGPEIDFNFPLIILDGELYDCFLDKKGETIISKIDSGILFQPRVIKGYISPCVGIVTNSYLKKYVRSQAKTMNTFLNQLSDLVNHAVNAKKQFA